MNQKNIVIYYISLSLFLFIILILMNYYSVSSNLVKEIDRMIIAIIFITISIFGVSLALHPKWYNKITKKDMKNVKINENNNKINREGHHPNCKKFQSHIILIKRSKYCAGCIGLALGAFVSILLMIYYFIIDNSQSTLNYQNIFFLGVIFIFNSYFESIIHKKNSIIHIIFNMLFIIGFLLIIISTLENSGDFIYGIISVLASFLFLETRIQISFLNHINTCFKCTGQCKMY